MSLPTDPPLQFTRPVILVGGGDINASRLQSLTTRGYPLIAADGGANRLRALDLVPAAVIGDLDSVEDLPYWQRRCQVLHLHEQDSTDFEKCLYSLSAPAFIGLGFTGRRFDHTLAAMHSLARYGASHNVLLVAESDLLWVRSGATRLQLEPDMRFSVYPLTRTTFAHSVGLAYPLDGLSLQQGHLIGTSNRTTQASVQIETADHDTGIYLVITPVTALNLLLTQLQGLAEPG